MCLSARTYRGFGQMKLMWDHLHKHNVLSRSPVGAKVIVCTLMTNVWTCVHGHNVTSSTFNCPPPTIEQYLGH